MRGNDMQEAINNIDKAIGNLLDEMQKMDGEKPRFYFIAQKIAKLTDVKKELDKAPS